MNIKKTFYLVTLAVLVAVAVAGYLLVPTFSGASTVSAQESASKADGEIATPEMLRYALDFKGDMAKSFSALNQLPCTEVDDTDLSGKSFKAGVYCLSSAQLAGQLVVDAESDPSAIFIFKVAGSLNTKNGSSVELANNAQASNIFFVTGDGATVREGTTLRGSIFAKNSVTVNDGAMVEGRLISLNNKISAPQSALAPQQFGTLQICKTVTPGSAAAASILGRTFQFTVTGVAGTITIGPITQFGIAGRVCTGAISVAAGAATITELNTSTGAGGPFVGGFQLFDVNVLSPAVPAGTLGSTIGVTNFPARTVGVNIVAGGGIQGQLTVELVNQAAVTGFIEICKFAATTAGGTADPDVTGFFSFVVEGVFSQPGGTASQVFTVPVGQCTNAIQVSTAFTAGTPPVANIFVTELARAGFSLESIFTIPTGRLLQTNITNGTTIAGSALVQVFQAGGVGGTNATNETIVGFVNRAAPGLVKVCKIAGPGIPLGTLFRFQVEGTGAVFTPAVPPATTGTVNPNGLVNAFVNVPAGSPATGGNCVFVPGFGGVGDAAGLQTFVNGTTVRVFELGTVDFPGSTVPFNTLISGEDIRVTRIRTSSTFTSTAAAGFTPNPTLTPGTRAAVTGPPALPVINFLGAGAVVARAGVVEVEFTNFAFTPTLLKVCKIAGTGITPNTPFTFDVAVVSPTSTGGVIGGTADLFPAFTTSVTVNAGPAAQGGNCAFVPTTGTGTLLGGAFDIGSTVTITERGTSTVQSITSSTSTTVAAGAATGGLSVNLGTRAATLFGTGGLVAGVNIVTFVNSTVVGPPGPGDVKAPFDFNGDGRSDISVYRPSNGTWYINNSGTESKMAATQFGEATDKTVPADYDGDNKADIANFRPSNGGWYILGSKNGLTSMQFGAPGDIPVPADFDADGKADVAVFRPSNGTWYVQRSTEGFLGVQFGQSGDQPVTADFDGDGKSDMAVFRPSNGTWYINQSGEGFKAIQFGLAGDKAVPADFDGDKRADVAVFRSGTWYVMGSKAGFMGVQFGQAGDTPVAADYDGDGKADMSVFRNGMWHVLQSKEGYTGIQFGMNTDTPVPASFLR
jgi:hypothetical protein